MTSRLDNEAIYRARNVPITDEITRRGLQLRRVGQELVGPCPKCGGTDRFAVNLQKQIWNCRRCQRGGNVIALLQHLDGFNFPTAVATLAGGQFASKPHTLATPRSNQHASPAAATPVDVNQQRAIKIWDEAGPIYGTLAERYLRETRKLELPADISPRVLRFDPACPFGGVRRPCLLALYQDIATDQPCAIMRTALTPDAQKFDRKALGRLAGAAIKLSDDADVTTRLVVGEGLETTLAGITLNLTPAWALGSAQGIAKFPVLSGIETLTILAETGDGGVNERALLACFDRWKTAGRQVCSAKSLIGSDINDALTIPWSVTPRESLEIERLSTPPHMETAHG